MLTWNTAQSGTHYVYSGDYLLEITSINHLYHMEIYFRGNPVPLGLVPTFKLEDAKFHLHKKLEELNAKKFNFYRPARLKRNSIAS